jgi:hypothetical protein
MGEHRTFDRADAQAGAALIEKALRVLNDLESKGFLHRYCVGGAVAALYYVDPFTTEDLDIFVIVDAPEHSLTPLARIYEELRRLGHKEDGAHVLLEGTPVQFLPAFNPLIEEAVAESVEVIYGSTKTRVVRAEHLAAIAVQTGRAKDRARLVMLREQASLDAARLDDILTRHGLTERYAQWTR